MRPTIDISSILDYSSRGLRSYRGLCGVAFLTLEMKVLERKLVIDNLGQEQRPRHHQKHKLAKTFPKHNQRANYVKYQYHEQRDLCEECIIIKMTEGDRCRKLIVDNGILI